MLVLVLNGLAGLAANTSEFNQLLLRAESSMKKRQTNEAVSLYRKAIRLKPRDSSAHAGLGWALFVNGQRDLGFQEEQKAVSLNPKDTVARHNLGTIYLMLNSPAKAADEFRQEYSIDPKRNCHCGAIKSLFAAYPRSSK